MRGLTLYWSTEVPLTVQVADAIRTTRHLHPILQAALIQACVGDHLVTSVTALARGAKRNRANLYRQWRAALRGREGPDLQEFIHWVVLVRAVEEYHRYSSLTAVAGRLGVNRSTLRRNAIRFTGRSFAKLVASPHSVLDPFGTEALLLLLYPAATEPRQSF